MGLACLLSMAAAAQWQWVDKDGRKVFSDRAPPAEVQEKDILKRPPSRAAAAKPADAAATRDPAEVAAVDPLASPAGSVGPKLSGVDKELLGKKKKAEEAELAKRKLEQESAAAAKADNCIRAKQSRASLTSGARIARMNEKGEREILDDAGRAAELKRVQSIVDSDCP